MDRLRFSDAPWFSHDGELIKVTIGGAGGIGSWLALFLTRAGFHTTVWDYDNIEMHNTGGQFYTNSQVGRYKTEAIKENIGNFSDRNLIQGITASIEDMDIDSYDGDNTCFFFSAFDNMSARKVFFENWIEVCASIQEDNPNTPVKAIFIDGRLEMEQLQVFCVPFEPRYIDRYREHLFDDSQVSDLACSMKQTSHTAAMIATFMTGFFTNYISNLNFGVYIRETPFLFEYVVAGSIVRQQILEDGSDFIPHSTPL